MKIGGVKIKKKVQIYKKINKNFFISKRSWQLYRKYSVGSDLLEY
jgi:hypothetical protein